MDSTREYQDVKKHEIEAQSINILIVSTTDVETKAFHAEMPKTISRVICGDYTYYIGKVGQYDICNVQCQQMGSLNPGGSTLTIAAALKEWPSIKAVIMMGICFGVDEGKQQIGDVIVSSAIKNYETRRIGEKEEIPRGNTYTSDKCLCNAFNNLKLSWQNIGIDNKEKNLTTGLYISGEQLVDNKEVRDKLLSETPEAKAGEMEGNGLVAACVSERIAWILVKAICDFADGKKGEDKKNRQAIAAASSASCCTAVLGQSTAFESLGIYSHTYREKPNNTENIDVLFELYKVDYEPYFLKREIDNVVESYISSHSLWVYGISGVGKSTSILHALTFLKKNVILINMAGINPQSTLTEIFEWIYNEVASYVRETTLAPPSYQLSIKRIVSMLDDHFANKEVYVLVEEIPFMGNAFSSFVASFSSLVVSDKLTGKSADVHFVLSSIENPLPHVQCYQQKIKSMVKFLEFEKWTDEECKCLIDLIESNITIPTVKNVTEMISLCDNLPRSIKTVFREVHQTGFSGELDSSNINYILSKS